MKKISVISLIVVLLLSLAGCSEKSQAGIGSVGDKPCYTVIMTKEERHHYFQVIGAGGQIAISDYKTDEIHVIDWSEVKGGGWIAWEGNRVRYVPEDYSETERRTAFASLRFDSSAMTIEEAEDYIPQVAEAADTNGR